MNTLRERNSFVIDACNILLIIVEQGTVALDAYTDLATLI